MNRLSWARWVIGRIKKLLASQQNVFLISVLLSIIGFYLYGLTWKVGLTLLLCILFIGKWKIVFILGIIVGIIRVFFVIQDYSISREYLSKNIVEFVGRIVEEPKYDDQDAKIVIEVAKINSRSITPTRVYTKISNAPIKKIGDICYGSGIIRLPIENDIFDFPKYLKNKNIFVTLEVEDVVCKKGLDIRSKLVRFREKISDRVEYHLAEPYSSLLIGILFGVDRVFTDDFANQLQVSGTTHIIAASGYNVLLVATLFYLLFGYLGLNYKMRLFISIAAIWVFAVVAGLSGSVIRASIMLSIVYFAKIFGVSVDKGYLILLTLVISVLWYPGLVFQLGYLLSLFATLGLISLSDRLSLGRENTVNKYAAGYIKDYIYPTFIAMLSTAPLLIISFSKISLMGMFSNLLVLPLLETTMALGFIGIVSSFFMPFFIVQIVFNGVYVQLWIFGKIIEYLSRLKFLLLEFDGNASIYGFGLVLFMLVILLISGYLKDKEDNFSEIEFYLD